MSTSSSVPVRGPDLQSEFQRLEQEFAYAYNKGDIEKIGSFYTPDAIVLPPHHEIVHGAVNIPSLMREYQQRGASDLKLEVTR